ncbi:MAG: pknB, partial [Aeromicrobium sp.]|nr:pknB [Aeromicrobium sp.]
TQTAAVIGTAQYLSPEQARGETVDARSDIYSTGCLLYELLTGRPPFIGDSPVSVAYQHVREEARPPSQLNPDVSQAIDHIVAKSLAKRVEDRYQSAGDMRKDIERVLAGHAVEAPTTTTAVVPGATAVAPAAPVLPPAGDVDPEEDEDGKPNWRAILGIIAVIAAVLLAVLWFAGVFDHEEKPPVQKNVTDVSGKDVDTATRALENAGFVVGSTTERPSADVEDGKVIETDPTAGTPVDVGSTIDLVVSSGPEQVDLPSLNGYSYDEAKKLLEDRGLKVKKQAQDSDLPRDQVINTNPPGPTKVDVGTTVTLIVSKGRVTVPDVVGQNIDDATKALEDLGLKVERTDDPAGTAPKDQVTAQSIAAGQSVSPGSTVQLTVSAPPDGADGGNDGGNDGGTDGGGPLDGLGGG